MKSFDIVIVGGSTTGSYFAHKMASLGYKVLVIDKNKEEKIGSKYDIFHIPKPDFDRFSLPFPEKGKDLAFEFTGSDTFSAYGHYPKSTEFTTIGMHMHEYTLRMNHWAKGAGAKYEYQASFEDFIYENEKIVGLTYKQNNEIISIKAQLVVDASGIPSVARRALPENYGVETFEISATDMFYVILRYVTYPNEKDHISRSRGWTYYKTWEAPQANPKGAILGIGANFSFEEAEKEWEIFEKTIELPEYQLEYKEKGVTPYRRPPYSFVGNRFIAMGDAACLTKPSCGEGVTSIMVQMDIAAKVVDQLLKNKVELTRQNLWPINKLYVDAQGKAYAGMLATLISAVSSTADENEYFFKKDLIFSKKSFEMMGKDLPLKFTSREMIHMALQMLWGLIIGKLSWKTIKMLLNGMSSSGKIEELYSRYPSDPKDFESWVKEANELWKACGTLADHK